MDLIKRCYCTRKVPLTRNYDLVVPLDYGTLQNGNVLPKATIAGIEKAAYLVKEGIARKVAWANTTRFGTTHEVINKEKFQLLQKLGLACSVLHAAVECTNSITEAERITDTLSHELRILIICDWRHARRAQKIWEHFFMGEVVVVVTHENWNEAHPSFWCRSNRRWLIGNLIHHLYLQWKGVEALRKIVHPVKK